jgi:hypothetical protein
MEEVGETLAVKVGNPDQHLEGGMSRKRLEMKSVEAEVVECTVGKAADVSCAEAFLALSQRAPGDEVCTRDPGKEQPRS